MSTGPTELIYASFDDDFLRLAKAKKTGSGYSVAGVYSKAVKGLGLGDLARETIAGLSALKPKSRKAILVFPSKYTITKNIEVPSLEPQEIEGIVRLQAVRHTPYAREEVIVGHLNLEVLLERYTRSLLVIASNDKVKDRSDVLEAAGLEVQAVRFSAEVIARAADIPSEELPAGFLVVESESTDFIVVQKGMPFFIRNIPVGYRLLKEDYPANIKQFSDELKKTLEAYQKEEQGVAIKSIWLSGAKSAPLTSASKSLEADFKVPVRLYLAEERLPVAPEAQSDIAAAEWTSFVDLIGAASTDLATIDLIPEEVKVRRSFKKKGQEIFTGGLFVLAIFALVIGIFLTKIYFRNTYLKEMHRNFEIKQKEADQLVAMSEKTRLVKDFKTKKGLAVKILDQSQQILPEQMYLSEISLSADGKVVMKGTSELMSTVFSFVTQLDNSPCFQNVTSDYTKSRKENDKDVSDFGISALIEENSTHG